MRLRYRICASAMGKLNLLVKTKLLFWCTIYSAFLIKTEANIAVCSPSNTNIAIDAQSPGVISKPTFPDGSSRTSCIWQIQAPENFRLAITIEALSLNGQDDYLAIRDGATTVSPLIGKYGPCTTGSLTLLSSGRSALLQLESAVHRTTDELKLSYSPTDPGDINCENSENPPGICSINTELTGLSGFVTTPDFPSNYDENEYCLWTILAPPGYRLQFSIHFLGIEDDRYSGRTCGDDSISVSEYRGNATEDIIKFCGCKNLFSFVSSEEKMFLTFRSYKRNNWPGFYASYKALAPEDCPRGELDCPRKNVEPIAFNAQSQVCTIIPKNTSSRVDVQRTSSAITSSSSMLSTPSSSRATSKYGTPLKETQDTISSSPLSPTFISATSHDLIYTPIQATISPNRSVSSFGKTVDGDDVQPIGQLKNSRHFSLSISHVKASPIITSSHNKALMTKQTEVGASSGSYQSEYKIRETQSNYITSTKTSDSTAFRSSETTIGQPSTRDPPVTITQSLLRGLAVKCSQFGMKVTISRILLPYLDIKSVRLNDPSCKVFFVNDTLAILSAPLEECGTQHNETSDYLIYQNTMTGDEKSSNSNSSITRDGTVKFEFQCSFRKLQVLSIVSYSTSSKVIYLKDGDGVGNFTFAMNMFEDPKYNLEVKQYPAVVYPGQPMYFQVKVRALDRNLLTFLEECWVTPSTDPGDKTRHTIIQHGCSRDSTLQYDYKKSPIQNFTFKAFQFRGVVSERLYVHCQVVTCRESDTDSVCERGCRKNGRRRRENKAFIMDEEVFLSLGPVSRQEQNKTSEHHDLVVYIKALAWILGTLALILATAMIVLIIRRRKLHKDKNNSWNLIALRKNDVQDEEEKRGLRTSRQDTGT
ncbi:uncharacterized protein LOC111325548 [Stylophora pistillata]|uniref:CUB and zona pellucida-like domain-containing protein 1 n=1 Tax=Stylophora pistillata TaxID=50429 RepID=A0A2B4SIR7_STYPI|nr:uncharacterized protein LOC111325548 [Stylophora pistillata]XP_022785112.1 uncharacterized protein LOC111325548 [Stylophora pistillata]PFX28983.1 CUB and zona pellucida-like domain-containing protein 1 [Stylophora pistillata]